MNKNKKNLASVTAKIFILIAVIMSSQAFFACSPNDDDCPKANMYEYVDLGLSVKWGVCNLGANSPIQYGDCYAWGEIEPKPIYDWTTYKWMQSGKFDRIYITKYTIADGMNGGIWYDVGGNFIGDGKIVLDAADDVATVKLGFPYRMPTYSEFQELIDNCIWEWKKICGVSGYEIKSKKNKNNIFITTTDVGDNSGLSRMNNGGCYWSSSLNFVYSDGAFALDFNSNKQACSNWTRCIGFPIRPVHP